MWYFMYTYHPGVLRFSGEGVNLLEYQEDNESYVFCMIPLRFASCQHHWCRNTEMEKRKETIFRGHKIDRWYSLGVCTGSISANTKYIAVPFLPPQVRWFLLAFAWSQTWSSSNFSIEHCWILLSVFSVKCSFQRIMERSKTIHLKYNNNHHHSSNISSSKSSHPFKHSPVQAWCARCWCWGWVEPLGTEFCGTISC